MRCRFLRAKKRNCLILLLGCALASPAFPQEPTGIQTPSTKEQEQRKQPVAASPKTPIDPQVKAVTDRMTAAGFLHPATVDQARRAFLFYATLSGPAENVFRIEDRTVPGPAGTIPIRLYYPNSGSSLPVWVFFHGGGFVAGSLDTHDTPLRAVANRCGCLIISVAYRLAPENHYPAATDDAYAATKWVADHAAEIGGDLQRIAVGGDGAGGNLAAVVALMARDRGGPHLVSQVLIYPILDTLMTSFSWVTSDDPALTSDSMVVRWSVYVPVNTDQQSPYISPANAGNFNSLPPTFMITGAKDPVRDTVELYATDLQSAHVPVEVSRDDNTIHSFFLMAGVLDAGKKCLDQTASDLKQAFEAPE